MPAVEFYHALGIYMQPCCIFQDWSPWYVTRHLVFKFPVASDFRFLGSELLDVFFNLFTEENFLNAYQCSILKGQFLILEELIKVSAQLSLLELDQRVWLGWRGSHVNLIFLLLGWYKFIVRFDYDYWIAVFGTLRLFLFLGEGSASALHLRW